MPPPIGKLDEPVDEPVSLLVDPSPVTGIADGSLVLDVPDTFVELLLLVAELLFAAGLLLVVVLLVVADGLLFVVELL